MRWGIHDGILLAAAKDAYDVSGGMSFLPHLDLTDGSSAYNSGFLIMNNNKAELRTMIQEWASCPDRVGWLLTPENGGR